MGLGRSAGSGGGVNGLSCAGGVHPGGAQSGMRLTVDDAADLSVEVLEAGHGQVIIAGRSRSRSREAGVLDAVVVLAPVAVLDAAGGVVPAGSTRVGSIVRVAWAHAA